MSNLGTLFFQDLLNVRIDQGLLQRKWIYKVQDM